MRRTVVPAAIALLGVLLIPHLAHAAGDACGNAFSEYQDRGWGWMYLASFGFGFLTSLTPCVYPMIPITLAIFGARGDNVSKKRSFLLASAYVVGMGLTYATLGVTIALLGKTGSFGSQLSSPYLVVPIVILFGALAASLFGAFNLQLPSSIQLKLNNVGGKGFGGAFAMGLVGGLIAAPCTGPFLLGLLTFVATTHSVVGGGSLLFVYAIGMGVLFWVLAVFAQALPKSGAWMEYGKSLGGSLLLFAAIYFLLPLVPELYALASPEAWFAIVMGVAVVLGIGIGGIKLSFHGPLGERLRKGAGIALMVGGSGGLWLWHSAPSTQLPWIYGDEKAAFETAKREHKGVMVDFAASWCNPCHELERTFGDPEVHEAILANFVPLKFDVSDNTDADDEHKAKYGANTLPHVVFLRADESHVVDVDREITTSEMLDKVRAAGAGLSGTIAANCN